MKISLLSDSQKRFPSDASKVKVLNLRRKKIENTVKSRFNEWPPSTHVDSLNRDFYLKVGLFNVNFHFGHKILFLKLLHYIKSRFVQLRLYWILKC